MASISSSVFPLNTSGNSGTLTSVEAALVDSTAFSVDVTASVEAAAGVGSTDMASIEVSATGTSATGCSELFSCADMVGVVKVNPKMYSQQDRLKEATYVNPSPGMRLNKNKSSRLLKAQTVALVRAAYLIPDPSHEGPFVVSPSHSSKIGTKEQVG